MVKRIRTYIHQKVGGALRKQRIPYMIIGGQAGLLYGEPKLTEDIDVTLGIGIGGRR